jgi:hypothetical protein
MQTNPHREHHGHLTVVPAGMRGKRLGIGVHVVLHSQRVQFPKHPDGRAIVAGGQPAFETGQGDAVLKGNAEITKFLRHQPRRFLLPESRFGVVQNGLGDVNEFITMTVNLSQDSGFDFLGARHTASYKSR